MFSSVFNTSRSKRKPRHDRSPFASTYASLLNPTQRERHQSQRTYYDRSDGESSEQEESQELSATEDEDSEDNTDHEASPLLPIFDSSRLDALPIYSLTHTIRLLVISRCETVLSWEQLRSPQVSQFLLKPIQQEIKTNHFSAATIYCLMANCLQFTKEAGNRPGSSGTSHTRAMICELLAIKLLREYTTRSLIDALSYDFDPLQGQIEVTVNSSADLRGSWQASRKAQPKSVRISCLEIAIRAEAKRLLAHPLVVQQLEAIWDGSIVFHSAADSLHRKVQPRRQQQQRLNYGTDGGARQERKHLKGYNYTARKTVTLYNPRDASLFKLSRLRVPRYRNILSTLSFAVLLCLFVAVLVQRSLEITSLEVVFWFWTAGYMLDEVVGFNEQGFGLYIASFWNTFDLGILILLFIHLCLRIYGILMVDVHKRQIANTAYDILAADAILLFPRLFSVLDHYRYFSQLIIAFRMMAADLMAVFILIVISCSGFFVALTLSFGNDGTDDPSSVAYALLQMLMGFTPAAWDRWDSYTPLGRSILTLFLFICHFLVVTILITVLTNSFMAVVRNANEEHQFLFAVNTISSVKSDSLFSFVAPLNVLQWLLTPLRYMLPLRLYMKVNRTVIKLTHFPILFSIYLYEKLVLSSTVVDRIDVIEIRSRARKSLAKKLPRLVRQPSVATFRQDQALEEVFKKPFDATLSTAVSQERHKSSNVVNSWINEIGIDTTAPPQEQDTRILDRLERRSGMLRDFSAHSTRRNHSRRTMSVASDPVDRNSHMNFHSVSGRIVSATTVMPDQLDLPLQQDGADGDDELLADDYDEDDGTTTDVQDTDADTNIPYVFPADRTSYFKPDSSREAGQEVQPDAVRVDDRPIASTPRLESPSKLAARRRPHHHLRNISSATMIYNPSDLDSVSDERSSDRSGKEHKRVVAALSAAATPRSKPGSSGAEEKMLKMKNSLLMRPGLSTRDTGISRSSPNLHGMSKYPATIQPPRGSSLEIDLVSDIGDNKALGGGYVGAIPASFARQMAMATNGSRQIRKAKQEEQEMLSRVVMARMNSLEEGFREVIHEVRENMRSHTPTSRSRSLDRKPKTPPRGNRDRRRGKDKAKSDRSSNETLPNTTISDNAYKPSQLALVSANSVQTSFMTEPEESSTKRDEGVSNEAE